MAGVWFPARMVVVRLSNGQLWVHSPIALTDSQANALEALGEVAYLVAPNRFHHLFLEAAREKFPSAKVHVSQALLKRSATPHDGVLGQPQPSDWQGVVQGIEVQGIPDLGESVFFHEPTGTLVLTDLLFNMRATRGWLTSLVLRAVGAYRRTAQSKLIRKMIQDPVAFQTSLNQILDLDFRRVIMAHGDILENGARDTLAAAFSDLK